jgi:hypothetical protein
MDDHQQRAAGGGALLLGQQKQSPARRRWTTKHLFGGGVRGESSRAGVGFHAATTTGLWNRRDGAEVGLSNVNDTEACTADRREWLKAWVWQSRGMEWLSNALGWRTPRR